MRSNPASRSRLLVAIAALLLDVCAISEAAGASRPAARGASGMVVSAEAHASRVGLAVLERGGNAVDAAVATAFALAVTFPQAGNLGGGGFLLHRSADGRFSALDFRETAPRALRPEHFLGPDGNAVPERALRGGLAVGVPGSVAGLAEAHRRWGRLPWGDLLRPAERLARWGFVLSAASASSFASHADNLADDEAARAIFTRDGRPLREGERLIQRDLSRALARIRRDGERAFYRGEIARAVVASVREAGGVMDEEDLASYRTVLREPVEGLYRGYRVVSFPPPSSGGITLLQILAMIERFDLRASGPGSSLSIHRMAEAERRAFADRARWMGDPDFSAVPSHALLLPAYLEDRGATIEDGRASSSSEMGPGRPPGAESGQTTHLSVADREGGAVALTTTLNSAFGAARVAARTGILLNNEIDDFALSPSAPNQYGLVGLGDANVVAGGKRPLSSMAPTIVEAPAGGKRPLLVLGSPGGPTIITTVLQILVNVVDHGMELQEAVDAPRFHHQWLPDRIEHEPRSLTDDVERALVGRGHALHLREPIGDAAAIGLASDGTWLGAADPRGQGLAAGY